MNQPTNQAVNEPNSQSINQSINLPTSQPVSNAQPAKHNEYSECEQQPKIYTEHNQNAFQSTSTEINIRFIHICPKCNHDLHSEPISLPPLIATTSLQNTMHIQRVNNT